MTFLQAINIPTTLWDFLINTFPQLVITLAIGVKLWIFFTKSLDEKNKEIKELNEYIRRSNSENLITITKLASLVESVSVDIKDFIKSQNETK